MEKIVSYPAQVVPYHDDLRPHFERLNLAWIEHHFAVESADLAELRDPQSAFLRHGGQIFFALDGEGTVVGTCAIAPDTSGRHPHDFHLSKMAVADEVRGRGYGDTLLQAALEFARASGAHSVTLVSNTRLAPALRLYEKHGFRAVPLDPDEQYARADIKMRLDLV